VVVNETEVGIALGSSEVTFTTAISCANEVQVSMASAAATPIREVDAVFTRVCAMRSGRCVTRGLFMNTPISIFLGNLPFEAAFIHS